jgi:hypothetical protein
MKTLIAISVALLLLLIGCARKSTYILTAYKRGTPGQDEPTITLSHAEDTIKAECQSNCDEYGPMVGQELSCFVEPPPSDRAHPYGTKRPIFNATGGGFVCYAGKGLVFMVRRYSCDTKEAMTPDQLLSETQLRNEYPEDSLFMSGSELDKLYCKPGQILRDEGGETVNEAGQTLPAGHSVELLRITNSD